ncbi:MAG TPA: N-acetylmuramoyl-L-alanine amidase [Thermoanaerobaculia bacterium]|nr:N-acetylmuramoyl-L-alanine amidase [Thermoanaerobaculia bacterium]
MTDIDRVKRRLLREAVQENLDTMRGLPRRVLRRRRRFALLGPGWLVLVPAALLGPSLVQPPADAPAAPVPAAAAPAPASPPVLPAPRPIDPAVFPLAVRRVVVDPGHGGASRGGIAPRGLLEKDLTLDIAERLERLLEAQAIDVVLTRRGDDSMALNERTAAANAAAGDLFLSIHVNWFASRASRGVETYYLGPTDDPELVERAAVENRDSGYSMAEFRRLLEGVYADVRQAESRRLAEAVQEELHRSLFAVNPAMEDRGVKTAPFLVLVGTEMPAVLAEVSCLSNEREAALLRQADYRQRIAGALAAGVHAYARARQESAPLAKGPEA